MDTEISWMIRADSAELSGVRKRLREVLKAAGMDEKSAAEVILAVDERLSNIIRHAYAGRSGTIGFSIHPGSDKITFSIRDDGEKFNPLESPAPELPPRKPGGLGNFLTRTLMDEIHYDESCTSGNLLHLVKYLKQPKDSGRIAG